MGFYSIIVPEATTNKVLNPSAEIAANYAAYGTATISRDSSYARLGVYSYKIAMAAANDGIALTLSALANAVHTVSFYTTAASPGGGDLQVSLNGSNWNTISIVSQQNIWTRVYIAIVAAESSGSTTLNIRCSEVATFYIDGVQCEEKAYSTTYIDGDQPGGRWAGLFHASTSTRDAQYRRGGRVRNLDDYGVYVRREFSGVGMPEIINNFQSIAQQPGSTFTSNKVQPRMLDLVLDVEGASWQGLHTIRQSLIGIIDPLRFGSSQFTLIYSGMNLSNKTAWLDVRYDSGLQFNSPQGFTEQPVLRLIAESPYWYTDDQQTATLDYNDSATVSGIAAIIDGSYSTLGGGTNGVIGCWAFDTSGNLYAGGNFTTAGGVTVNYIGRWNGFAWSAIGGATKGTSGRVYCMAFTADGKLFVGGNFATAGGTTVNNFCLYDPATDTFSAVGGATKGVDSIVRAVDVHYQNDYVFLGGDFANAGGAAAVRLARYRRATDAFAAIGAGANGAVRSIVCASSADYAYIGGSFTTLDGVAANRVGIITTLGTVYASMGIAGMNDDVNALKIMPDGSVIAGGNFTTVEGVTCYGVAQYVGGQWYSLSIPYDTTPTVSDLTIGADSVIYAAVSIDGTEWGLSSIQILKYVNGSWLVVNVGTPARSNLAMIVSRYGDLYFGSNVTGGTNYYFGSNTLTNTGTAPAYPVFTIVSTATITRFLYYIENRTTKQMLYFNLPIRPGETVTIDLRQGRKIITNNIRGLITNNPLVYSDLANWRLDPGSNDVRAFANIAGGAAVTDLTITANWQITHLAVDGAA